MRMPGQRRPGSGRGGFGLLLCILLPPFGLLFIWRKAVFPTRGRMLVTALATVEMAAIMTLMLPRSAVDTHLPVPAAPSRVTPAPESNAVSALSNIDQLLYQAQLEKVIAQGGSEDDLMSEDERLAKQQAENEAVLNTIVYCVNSNPKLYHSQQMCGNQSNRVELTVQEALRRGLGPCTDCSAPVYSPLTDSTQ